MASIAVQSGFLMETLWNLPENAELKALRKDPHVLFPGDQVFIPDLRVKEISCATDIRHQFTKKGVSEHLRVVLLDDQDQPITDKPYVLLIDKTLRFTGNTDASGAIEQSIPPTSREGYLIVGESDKQREYHIALGHVDPLDQISGAQGRLLNLGYYDSEVNGQRNAQTATALMLFQTKYDLPASGENDDATQAKLKDVFGC